MQSLKKIHAWAQMLVPLLCFINSIFCVFMELRILLVSYKVSQAIFYNGTETSKTECKIILHIGLIIYKI